MNASRTVTNAIRTLALSVGLLITGAVWAQPAETAQQQVYGWELMSADERAAFQERMRSATTAQERERIRAEHHAQMQARAQERGVTLRDMAPGRGPGQGQGQGQRQGKGQGQDQGEGKGKGQGKGPGKDPGR